ncbi:sigma-70 family RNA polymerase sigma factor [Enterocloster clostridioformis]|uniref:sigma-70 family RNA polymerase sigma factor n=1 Tax=Enterocloster clostridioformis TaxID=1531 RepID=UPI00156E654C|nr:sigma-70 family RNA polymerase sigma factor [Enterocloster clostridioformis]NSJ55645.1 sigma-70 family RNA polymerase sigma factor [Enterocloster clostridioformis]
MTNEELVEQIQAGINVKDNLATLYEQNKPFIYSVIKPMMKYADPDDLFQEAYFGLHDAVYAYKPGEAKFLTYLPWKIRKYCIHFIESFSNTKRIPHSRQIEIRKYQKFCQEYTNANGTEPDDKTIMKELELTAKKLENIRKTIYEQNCISIHKPVAGTEDAALEDILADDADIAAEVEDQVFQDEIKKVVNDAVDQLPQNQAFVIRARYLKDSTQTQIASDLNVSFQRISQIENKALDRLQKMKRLQELHDEIYGYDSHYAYGMSVKCAVDNHTSATEKLALKRIEHEEFLKHQKEKIQKLDEAFAELLEG